MSYYRVNSPEIDGIRIYINHWIPESWNNGMRKEAAQPPRIGLTDGTNSIEFGNAEELSNFMQKFGNGYEEAGEINLPIDSLGEIAKRLWVLADKILWVLVP